MNKAVERIKNGIVTENPTFVQILGMCPTLAVTTSAINGIGMGLSTTVILIMSNLLISALRNVIPNKVRIPAYIVIVASFVTIVDFLLQAFLPGLSESLGSYIKLIVVNCIILGRAESYASKNPVIPSVFDGVGMGLGFTIGLTSIGIVREILGAGTAFGFAIPFYQPIGIFVLAPGAFIVLAFLIAFLNWWNARKAKKTGNDAVCRMEDCAHCGNSSCGGKFFDFSEDEKVSSKKIEEPIEFEPMPDELNAKIKKMNEKTSETEKTDKKSESEKTEKEVESEKTVEELKPEKEDKPEKVEEESKLEKEVKSEKVEEDSKLEKVEDEIEPEINEEIANVEHTAQEKKQTTNGSKPKRRNKKKKGTGGKTS